MPSHASAGQFSLVGCRLRGERCLRMGLPDIENIPETGAVFTIGRSRFADNVASHFFIRKDPVVTIACGDEHSAVVCQSGRLFVFGSNDWGQLGLGHKNHVSKPSCVKILKPEKVTHVACGRTHTLICTGSQKIFACGSDQEGQLGRGSSAVGDSASSPVLVYDCGLAGPRIVQIAAGSHHSMALNSDGEVIAWGSNLEGQLGLAGISGLVNKPTKVPFPESVKAISAGYYHSAFLTENGQVYVCGESESGKLGIDVNFSTQVAPKQMQLSSTAVQVSCGGHHTFILAENGELYCAGSNANGQLGMGTDVAEVQTAKLLRPSALEEETVVKAVCGESHTAILTESGKLFTCGDGRHGKLGLEENENNVDEVTYASKYQELFVANVSCGGCHTILVGRRRENNRQTQPNAESIQMAHSIQKMNPLPPLKLPVNRLQNDARTEKADETDKIEIDKSNKTENVLASENTQHARNEDKKNSRENSVERNDSINNNKYIETPAEESTATPTQTESGKTEENDSKETSKIDSENNVKEEEKVQKDDVHDVRPASSDQSKNVPDNLSEEKSEEKQSNTDKESSPSSIPPPKPPRQKLGSPENSEKGNETAKTLTRIPSKEEEITVCDSKDEENDDNDKKDKSDKALNEKDESPAKESTSSRKSRPSNWKTEIEETIQDNVRNPLEKKVEKIIDGVKTEVDNMVDDADVIQSPAPRTGKMAKLFRAKRQQEIENGTRKAGNAVAKAKSKTCTIL